MAGFEIYADAYDALWPGYLRDVAHPSALGRLQRPGVRQGDQATRRQATGYAEH